MNQMSKRNEKNDRADRFVWKEGDVTIRKPTEDEIKQVAKLMGAKGGAAGRGAAKARPSEQARAAANARWAKYRKEREERENG